MRRDGFHDIHALRWRSIGRVGSKLKRGQTMGSDIMIAVLLVIAAGFGMLAAYAFVDARRDRSKRIVVAAVAGPSLQAPKGKL